MRKSGLTWGLAIALCLRGIPCVAQAVGGDLALGFNGSVSTIGTSGSHESFGSLTGQVGYYLSPEVQLRGVVGLSINTTPAIDGSSSSTNTSGIFGAGAAYNFFRPGRHFVPYVAADLTVETTGGGAGNTYFVQPAVGFNYYFQRNVSFLADLALGFQLGGGTSSASTLGSLQFGFNFVLPRSKGQ